MREQLALHLARLHAEAAYLDLIVAAAEIDHLTRGQQLTEVTRAIDFFFRLIRIDDELAARQLVASEISATYTTAADADLARHPNRQQSQLVVENVGGRGRDGHTDVACVSRNVFVIDLFERDVYGRFRDAVHVDEFYLGMRSSPLSQQRRSQCFTAEDDVTKREAPSLIQARKIIKRGRSLVQNCHLFVDNQIEKQRHVFRHL